MGDPLQPEARAGWPSGTNRHPETDRRARSDDQGDQTWLSTKLLAPRAGIHVPARRSPPGKVMRRMSPNRAVGCPRDTACRYVGIDIPGGTMACWTYGATAATTYGGSYVATGGQTMRVIAVANHKGGVGKTTVAVNLAAGLAKAGRRTLLVDADAQSHATTWLSEVDEVEHDLRDVIVSGIPVEKIISPTRVEGLD